MSIISYLSLPKKEFSLRNPKQSSAGRIKDDLSKVGLKTLIDPTPYAPRIIHSYTGYTLCTARKPPPPPSSMFRSSVTDDVIGTESGDYMSSSVEDLKGVAEKAEPHRNRRSSRCRKAETRKLPRPITLLTQAGGMPWVFRRENDDGRLIMRAERMKRHECLEAHRLNGRLTMKLVAGEDDTVYCEDCGHPMSERLERESGESEELRKVVGREEGSVQELEPLWNGKGMEGPEGCLGGPSSTSFGP